MSAGDIWFGVIIAASISWIAWFVACRRLGRLKEWHHIWIGLPGCLIPWHLWIGWWALLVWFVFLSIVFDDAELHWMQSLNWRKGDRKLTGADDGASFWHRLAHHFKVI